MKDDPNYIKNVFYFIAIVLLCTACLNHKIGFSSNGDVEIKKLVVEAPFGKVNLIEPDFSAAPEYNIKDFGADLNDKSKTLKAINHAIAKANNSGGGKVIIPKGEWLTGKIHLKNNVNLHLEEDAILVFSANPQDYLPPVKSTWEGMECYNYSPLIYAYNCRNIAITGTGKLKANMETWEKWFGRPKGHMESLKLLYNMAAKGVPLEKRQMVNDSSNYRPQFIQFNRCENVLLEGVEIENSPFWVIHPFLSKNVIIRNVKVKAHGHNNDGVDPEMSQNVLIENCVFDQGDDAIAIKSGRNQDAWRLNTPSKNIIIRNCLVKNGHQLLAIGSELSGGIENIHINNCEVDENADLRHLLFVKTNERRGGFVRNIYMENIKAGKISSGILGIETDVLYQWRDLVQTYERRLTTIENIFIKDIKAGNVDFISKISGNEELPVKNINLSSLQIDTIRGQKFNNKNVSSFKINQD